MYWSSTWLYLYPPKFVFMGQKQLYLCSTVSVFSRLWLWDFINIELDGREYSIGSRTRLQKKATESVWMIVKIYLFNYLLLHCRSALYYCTQLLWLIGAATDIDFFKLKHVFSIKGFAEKPNFGQSSINCKTETNITFVKSI